MKNIAITLILVLIGSLFGCNEHLSPTDAADEKGTNQPPTSFATIVDRVVDTMEMPTIVKEPTDILSLFQDPTKNIRVSGIYRNMMRIGSASWNRGRDYDISDYSEKDLFGSLKFEFNGSRTVTVATKHISFFQSSNSSPKYSLLDLYVEDARIDSLYYTYYSNDVDGGNTVHIDLSNDVLGIRNVAMLKLSPYKYKVILTGKRVENLITEFKSRTEISTNFAGARTYYGHSTTTTLLPATDDSYLEISIEAL
ncbi:MAG: hypothetical protein AB7H80_03280 [Candidatus Kapaibacterium sp.]